jgi:hypothetical protein
MFKFESPRLTYGALFDLTWRGVSLAWQVGHPHLSALDEPARDVFQRSHASLAADQDADRCGHLRLRAMINCQC